MWQGCIARVTGAGPEARVFKVDVPHVVIVGIKGHAAEMARFANLLQFEKRLIKCVFVEDFSLD